MARQLLTGPENEWDPAQALPLAQKAVTLTTPEVPMYLNTLGVAYYRLGRYEQAIETLERSLRGSQGEDAADNLFFLALCHSQRGELAKAKLCYERGAQCVKDWQDRLPAEKKKELDTFSAEAEALLRQQAKH
jgi:tetratricopeptide (TPR) repeat protein